MKPDVVYVVLNRYTSFVYGVYLDMGLALAEEARRNDELGYEMGQLPPVRLTAEPVLNK